MSQQSEHDVWQPPAASPIRGAAVDGAEVEHDILALPRQGEADVGCDEHSDAPVLNHPLRRGDVGPSWVSALSAARSVEGLFTCAPDEALRARQAPGVIISDRLD